MSISQGIYDYSRACATQFDDEDPLRQLRKEFIIPTKADLKSRKLTSPGKTCIC